MSRSERWFLVCAGRWAGYARRSQEAGGPYFGPQADKEWAQAVQYLLLGLIGPRKFGGES